MVRRRRIPVWTIAGLIGAGLLPAPAPASAPASTAPGARDGALEASEAPLPAPDAVREGNRRFRRGDPAGAVEAYRRAGDEALRSDPVLAYNLATALHRIDHLPEAVLWYRRARRHLGDDPWVSENLERARAALAAPRPGPPPAVAPFLLHPRMLPACAAVVAWWALAVVAWPRRRRTGAGTGSPGGRLAPWLLAAAALLWAAQLGLDRLGPQPAVLMEPCGRALPAGSEVWVRPVAGDPGAAWIVHGGNGGARCPAGAVATL